MIHFELRKQFQHSIGTLPCNIYTFHIESAVFKAIGVFDFHVSQISNDNSGPVYTIPFSFHIGLGKAIRYENFYCLHDAVFISCRIGFMPLSERFHLKTRKRYEAYRIGAFSCKQEANPTWNGDGIV